MQGNVAKAVSSFCYSVATRALYRSSKSERPVRVKRREAEVFWTTDFQPSSRWDVNWDKQEPEYCVRPPLNSSEEEKRQLRGRPEASGGDRMALPVPHSTRRV
ncbi:hypothetical protein HPB50_022845 [Hyalomma asiaticum]|uniref:Uncharacterized protein n=1 Tax=Hyalomma asiaticum TaxID=266040 RepID=A0ACB7SI72_HYAAI|nr:hypothetical protein HPB50_022845 [Hyalomma asiaticum]